MNREETEHLRDMLTLHLEGGEVESRYRHIGGADWREIDDDHEWDSFANEYRAKPKPREGWVQSFQIHSRAHKVEGSLLDGSRTVRPMTDEEMIEKGYVKVRVLE